MSVHCLVFLLASLAGNTCDRVHIKTGVSLLGSEFVLCICETLFKLHFNDCWFQAQAV